MSQYKSRKPHNPRKSRKVQHNNPSSSQLTPILDTVDLFVNVINFVSYNTLYNIIRCKSTTVNNLLFKQNKNIPELSFEIDNFEIDNNRTFVRNWIERASTLIFRITSFEWLYEPYPGIMLKKLEHRLSDTKVKRLIVVIPPNVTYVVNTTLDMGNSAENIVPYVKFFNRLMERNKRCVVESNAIKLLYHTVNVTLGFKHLWVRINKVKKAISYRFCDINERLCIRVGISTQYRHLKVMLDFGILHDSHLKVTNGIKSLCNDIPFEKISTFKVVTHAYKQCDIQPIISLNGIWGKNTLVHVTYPIFKEIVSDKVIIEAFIPKHINDYLDLKTIRYGRIGLFNTHIFSGGNRALNHILVLEDFITRVKCYRLDLGYFYEYAIVESMIIRIIFDTNVRELHFHIYSSGSEGNGGMNNYSDYNNRLKIKIHFY